ncbi:carboxy terminal-processing peptidase [Bermanella sp. WJH001]|uniref:carboxy terminal-processing peptidase n=1 Tax=Bermanella sp. WJH001 TaxID=3048005 RepID=UPI0024BD9A25|nr:carboxy terminal-processing peptidase [Bermanella sp. WJH001]MDJ1537199.1 carboxy terminal-processing peptidase [Bermanella sp. WJH001]
MLRHLIIFSTISWSFFAQATTTDIPVLKPQSEHVLTNRTVVQHLYQHHYSRKYMNDEFSEKVYTRYLNILDNTRSYFTQADIDQFEQYRDKLDDAIKTNNLDPAFVIYNRYEQRAIERLDYALALLKGGIKQFNFKENESLELDREKAPWAKSSKELDILWNKRIKNTVLNLKLAGKEDKDIIELLERRYESQLNRIKQINAEDAFQSYMNALTYTFDPHTQYMSPRNSENFNINMSLSLQGIGAVLRSENENTIVERLVPGGPAAKANQLKPSDKIIGVAQGKDEMVDVIGWRLDEVVDLIRGPKDSTVRLDIISGSGQTETHRTISIVRDEVKLEDRAAQSEVINIKRNDKAYKLGVIDIPAFYADFEAKNANDPNYRSTTRDVSNLITQLKSENIDGLIIDLRNNGGGSLAEVNNLVGLFIPQGPTVQVHYSFGHTQVLADQDPSVLYNGPLVVLTNRLSASASEIFAGAIQDYSRGLIVGSQTFGKGTVQTLIPLFRGQMKVTNAKFYRVSGESTQHRGVIPDILYPEIYDIEKIGESALEEALAWDKIEPSKYKAQSSLSGIIPSLQKAHAQRIKNNPDFEYLNEQVEFLKELRNDTSISLNIDTREKERLETEARRLALENKRRKAKGLKQLDKLEEQDEDESTQDPDKKDATEDALLIEGGEILVDFMNSTANAITKK